MQSNPWALVARPGQAWLLRQGELRYRLFSGAPIVEVSPAQWDLDPTLIRQTAFARRYREIAPDQDGLLRFEFVPQFGPPPFDRPFPGTPDSLRRLAKLVEGQLQVWVSLRRLGVSRVDVARAAEIAGLQVVCEFADPTDRLMLLRRPGLPGELTCVPYQAPWHRRVDPAQVRPGLYVGALFAILGALMLGNLTKIWAIPLIAVPVFLVLLIAGLVTVHLLTARSPRITWLDEPFDGRAETSTAHSSVSTELLGEVASAYGYFYAGSTMQDRLFTRVFVKCCPGLLFGPPIPRQRAPQPYNSDVERPGREQWLRNRISGEDDVWISVREAKLPSRRIAEIAAQEGLAVAMEFADTTDRVLRLSRGKPERKRRFRMSFLNYVLPAAWILCCAIPGVVLYSEDRIVAVLFGLGLLLTPAMFRVLRVFPRSTRVGWLAREFNGADGVTFFVGPYGISPALTVQIAEAHGYFFGTQSSTRAQGVFVTFVRRR